MLRFIYYKSLFGLVVSFYYDNCL